MRVTRRPRSRNADHVEQFGNAFVGVPTTRFPMQPDRLGDLIADGAHRVEGVHRALEHHRDIAPAVWTHTAIAAGEDVDPSEQDLPGNLSVRRQQAHHREHHGGLAASRLADDPKPIARVQGEGDSAHGMQLPTFDVEVDT